LGTLAENPGVEVTPIAVQDGQHDGLRLAIGSRPDPPASIVRLSEPHHAPGNPDPTQQSKIAAALTRAGVTNPAACAAAGVPYIDVRVATRQVSQISVRSESKAPPPPATGFDVTPPVVVMKGSNDPSFFISWQSQRELIGTLGRRSAAMIWGGGGLALL